MDHARGEVAGDGPGRRGAGRRGGERLLLPGPADGPVLAEACESDGTLTGYHPGIGLIHNISRDHGEVDALRPQFEAFARHASRLLVSADSADAAAVGRAVQALTYGAHPSADARLEVASAGPDRAVGALRARSGTLTLDVPQPGRHNLDNAAAAALVALELGIPPRAIEAAIARFPGVARRYEVIGVTGDGIRVVDDYAHNGEKLRAAITTAQLGAPRLVAVFQPHGFGPARFLRPELKALLPRLLRAQDRFCYAEIFYAGAPWPRTCRADCSPRTCRRPFVVATRPTTGPSSSGCRARRAQATRC